MQDCGCAKVADSSLRDAINSSPSCGSAVAFTVRASESRRGDAMVTMKDTAKGPECIISKAICDGLNWLICKFQQMFRFTHTKMRPESGRT